MQKEHDRLVAVIESLQQPAKSPPTMLAAAVLGTAWTGGRVSDEAIPALRPPVRGLRPREAAVQGRGNPDRQRRRVRLAVPHHVLDLGIGHVYIKPATPRLNGKVERSHRIDQEESYRMLEGVVIDDTGLFNDRLQEWETFYNFNRPHGGLGGQTPYERLREKTRAPA